MTVQQAAEEERGFVDSLLVDIGLPAELTGPVGSVIVFVVVAVVLYALSRFVLVPAVDSLLRSREVTEYVRSPIRLLLSGVTTFVAVAFAFALAGFGNILVTLTTIGAAATLAIGLALQNVVRNFVAGVFIYTDKPFRTGDWIEWGDDSGVVEDIGLRVTRVQTFDNEYLTVPNSQLTDDVIKNYDKNGTLRLKFTFRIGLREDVDRATEIILNEAGRADGVLADPEPSVKLTELNDSSLGLQSRIWVEEPSDSDFMGIRGQFVQAVTERFEQEEVTVPYPHRTLDGSLGVPGTGQREPTN